MSRVLFHDHKRILRLVELEDCYEIYYEYYCQGQNHKSIITVEGNDREAMLEFILLRCFDIGYEC